MANAHADIPLGEMTAPTLMSKVARIIHAQETVSAIKRNVIAMEASRVIIVKSRKTRKTA